MEAMGRIGMGDHNGPITGPLLDALFELIGNKQEELQACVAPIRVCFA
jgi:hypothetical protein